MKLRNKLYLLSKLVLCALFALSVSSCGNEWLEVEPSNAVSADGAINSVSTLETVRTGMYKALKGSSTFADYYAALFFVYAEVHGEDIQYNVVGGSARASFYYYMTYTSTSDFTLSSAIWQSPYIVIGRANRIIEAANATTISDYSSDSATVKQYKNEALVLRALAHFDLARVYGKPYTEDSGASLGVPVVTSVLQGSAKLARNTVAECYEQAISDLTTAINSGALSTSVLTTYVDYWTAKAILMRVYFSMGDNTSALSVAEDIISNAPYTLWTTSQYVAAFDETDSNHNNEIIFEIGISGSDDWTDRNGIAYLYTENGGSTASGYGDMVATKAFVDSLTSDSNDVRNDVFIAGASTKSVATYGTSKVFLNKFPPQGSEVRYDNVPLIRFSEIYLTAAEAAYALGNTTKAVQYLNNIIENRTTTASKVVTASNITADRIYMERRKELVGEGHRYWDALRRGETITRYTSSSDQGWHAILTEAVRSYDRTYYKALSAIPEEEMNGNSNMVQNSGYGD